MYKSYTLAVLAACAAAIPTGDAPVPNNTSQLEAALFDTFELEDSSKTVQPADIAAAREARTGKSDAQLNVINYASKFGKTYRTVTELNKRARNLKANTGRREQSRKNNPLATFGDTPYSDWSEEEMSDLLGLRTDGVRPQLRQAKPVSGLTVEVAMGALDWAAAGNMHAVKNQGSCGSCAAFTAVGVIEAMVSIQNANAAPVALSVQQGLDCSTGNYSCNGGWMEKYFEFYSAGAMLASDYPYAMRDQACQQTSESTFAATADWSSFVWLDQGAAVADMHAELSKGPLSVAVAAENWWFDYTSGVITDGERSCDPRGLNHGLILVGYQIGGTVTEDKTTTTQETYSYECRWATRSERRQRTCPGEEFYYSKRCCTETVTPGTTTTETVTITNPNAWRIQNQWGNNWGEDGFMRLEAIEGAGICGINQEVQGIAAL